MLHLSKNLVFFHALLTRSSSCRSSNDRFSFTKKEKKIRQIFLVRPIIIIGCLHSTAITVLLLFLFLFTRFFKMIVRRAAVAALQRTSGPNAFRSTTFPRSTTPLLATTTTQRFWMSTVDVPPAPTSNHPHKPLPGAKGSIIYTETDEAPALATYSLYPAVAEVRNYYYYLVVVVTMVTVVFDIVLTLVLLFLLLIITFRLVPWQILMLFLAILV